MHFQAGRVSIASELANRFLPENPVSEFTHRNGVLFRQSRIRPRLVETQVKAEPPGSQDEMWSGNLRVSKVLPDGQNPARTSWDWFIPVLGLHPCLVRPVCGHEVDFDQPSFGFGVSIATPSLPSESVALRSGQPKEPTFSPKETSLVTYNAGK